MANIKKQDFDPSKLWYSDDIINAYTKTYIKAELDGYNDECNYLLNRQLGTDDNPCFLLLNLIAGNTEGSANLKSAFDKNACPALYETLGNSTDIFDELIPKLREYTNCKAKIVFGYNRNQALARDQGHWLTAEIDLEKKDNEFAINCKLHNPYGGGKWERSELETLKTTFKEKIFGAFSPCSIFITDTESSFKKRQKDNTSCGVIVADEIIKLLKGENLDIESPYTPNALELRRAQYNYLIEKVGVDYSFCKEMLKQINLIKFLPPSEEPDSEIVETARDKGSSFSGEKIARRLIYDTQTEEGNVEVYFDDISSWADITKENFTKFLSKIDSKDNNILHYAVSQHNIDLINAILSKAKEEGKIEELINQRNKDGTNPLGMAFLFQHDDNLKLLEIASIFAATYEYKINSYLNNKIYMDYSSVRLIGGRNLLHNILLAASKYTNEKTKKYLSKFFEILRKRMEDTQIEDGSYFSPNYPTMNPGKLAPKLDGHMMSTSRLLEVLTFSSEKIETVCKKHFQAILRIYEATQFDDSSGDSEDESSHSHFYREMLLEFDRFIKDTLEGFLSEKVSGNFQRTFDKYNKKFSIAPYQLLELISTDDIYNEDKDDNFWKRINAALAKEGASTVGEKDKKAIDSFAVPLFHGVPFMQSQYTNYQRREVVKKLFAINRKLFGKFSGSMSEKEYELTPEEKILIGIHSRTSTATAGMQSLYEIITANEEELKSLEEADNKLLEYFTRERHSDGFREAMKQYIFNFLDSPIQDFWEENHSTDGTSIMPDKEIVKYRFPVIATSKAPDHAIRFAIGRNVEAARGETPMQPEYKDGQPTHRLAGLVYVTLHNLSDLIRDQTNLTMIDVNQSLASKDISAGTGAPRFKNQLECDFLGKMDSDRIVAVIPVIYPNVKEGKVFQEDYHTAIYSIASTNKSNTSTSPKKLGEIVSTEPNPSIIPYTNVAKFGKMMVPSLVSMINGVLVSIAELKGKFLCAITETNELIPYKVGFDKEKKEFSEAKKSLQPEGKPEERLWSLIVKEQLQTEITLERTGTPTTISDGSTETDGSHNSVKVQDITRGMSGMAVNSVTSEMVNMGDAPE